MGTISSLFGYLLNWLYEFVGNYGLSIILFSIIIRIILIPITVKQQRSMKKSSEMQDKMKVLQVKYKNNPEELNKATMELYKSENFSPFSGCLSSIIQIIVILSVFWLVSKPLTYMRKIDSEKINSYIQEISSASEGKTAYAEISVIQNKGAEDPEVYINMDFLGLDLNKVPGQNLKDIKVYIIPVLYVISTFLSMRLNNNMQSNKNKRKVLNEKNEDVSPENIKQEDPAEETMESMQEMTKSMSYMMPIMSISIVVIAPLGMSLYWLVSNILMMIERIIVNKIYKN